jgi:hypothetical protein
MLCVINVRLKITLQNEESKVNNKTEIGPGIYCIKFSRIDVFTRNEFDTKIY